MQRPRVKVVDVLKLEPPRSGVRVKGWLRTVRDSKQVVFLEINDGSCFASVQAVCPAALVNFERQIHGFITMGRVIDEANVAVQLCAAQLRAVLQP